MELKETFQRVKAASKELALISDERKNAILLQVADAIIAQKDMLLRENAKDLARMEQSNPLYDRLQLTDARLEGIASDMRHVATLENPLGKVLKHRTLENGLVLTRISVPFGVIGVIYEARPNVTADIASLCIKTGNVCVLRGGSENEFRARVDDRAAGMARRAGERDNAVACETDNAILARHILNVLADRDIESVRVDHADVLTHVHMEARMRQKKRGVAGVGAKRTAVQRQRAAVRSGVGL